MLLRSSSTPVIGSLLASFSAESPLGNHFEPKPSSIHSTPNKFSFHTPGPLNISHSSSPISPSIDLSSGFLRRAQSDGNLEGLAYAASCEKNEDDPFFCDLYQHNNSRSRGITLQTIQSFSTYNSADLGEDDDEEDSDREYDEEEVEEVEAIGGDNVGLEEKVKKVSLSEDMITMQKMWGGSFEEQRGQVSQEMHLAKGLGIDGGSGGGRGGREAKWKSSGGDGGDNNKGVEEHYKKMVEEHPGNPLFLGNYANFLYETKRDLPLAEEYYSRSILADPNDGEILAQYAKVIWELHHDEDRALSYYERAVQAAPQDSFVHAAYASFLWTTEEDDEDEDEADRRQDLGAMSPYIHGGIMTSASA
ncbi:PREDICTED: uncharacterized protein LOC101302796 [Fragaria vesca subsp. vesca]|uniref:uncharacterized protein LOC101302796 n=1 Tax=Fragaria vesca subsp. vesca TaxID=101020 RepID=UPI0002C36FAC|nr:PREDICTED: uncharacterized protein LOC101302796 [Fragaria vesca subsp. vesca]